MRQNWCQLGAKMKPNSAAGAYDQMSVPGHLIIRSLGALLGAFGRSLGALWGVLGRSWAFLGAPWALLGALLTSRWPFWPLSWLAFFLLIKTFSHKRLALYESEIRPPCLVFGWLVGFGGWLGSWGFAWWWLLALGWWLLGWWGLLSVRCVRLCLLVGGLCSPASLPFPPFSQKLPLRGAIHIWHRHQKKI